MRDVGGAALSAPTAFEPEGQPTVSAAGDGPEPSVARATLDAARPMQAPAGGEIAELSQVVQARWAASGEFTEQTLLRCGETITRFTQRLARQGVTRLQDLTPAHCQGFIDAMTSAGRPPELTTRHARRTSLRMWFRTLRDLGHDVGDPTLDLRLPARTVTAARPLTDTEITLCRASTRMGEAGAVSLQRAVCWALAEATAVTSEISAVRVCDVDDPNAPTWVHLPGTRRARERLGELSGWGSHVLARQITIIRQQQLGPNTLLSYRGRGTPGQHVAQAAVCNALGEVLRLAGLASEPDVRPASVRNWAGRRLYDQGMPLEQVARRMGARSLDAVAEDIALTWNQP